MTRLPRLFVSNVLHNFTQRSNRREKLLFEAGDYALYFDPLARAAWQAHVEIWLWCLMPNHVHILAVPADENALGRLFYPTTQGSLLRHAGSALIAEHHASTGAALRHYVHGPGTDEPLVWYEGAGTADWRWKRSGRGSALPDGVGRGIAIVESFGSIVAEVVEASVAQDGSPKVLKTWAVVDCGTTVNSLNAEAPIEGGLIMGLSSAIGDAVTLDKGAVVESNFTGYPIPKLADAPPASSALANAPFAATDKRIPTLPMLTQAKS